MAMKNTKKRIAQSTQVANSQADKRRLEFARMTRYLGEPTIGRPVAPANSPMNSSLVRHLNKRPFSGSQEPLLQTWSETRCVAHIDKRAGDAFATTSGIPSLPCPFNQSQNHSLHPFREPLRGAHDALQISLNRRQNWHLASGKCSTWAANHSRVLPKSAKPKAEEARV